MTTLKEELKKLIDDEGDVNLLEEVKIILTGKRRVEGKEFMTLTALKGKEDSQTGRVPTRGEAFARKDPSKMKG